MGKNKHSNFKIIIVFNFYLLCNIIEQSIIPAFLFNLKYVCGVVYGIHKLEKINTPFSRS